MDKRTPYTSLNPFFLVPFVIWVVVGALLLLAFDKEQLFSSINGHHTSFSDVLMYYITYMGEGGFITIVLLLLLGIGSFRNWWYFTAALCSNVIPAFITQFIKHRANAPRPLKYFNEARWIHTLPEWPRLMEHSFPSGHTCGAFGLFCFLALLLPYRYRVFGLLFFLLAILVAYSRMYLAAHFFIDVYVGSIIGTTFTLLINLLMKRFSHLFFKRVK